MRATRLLLVSMFIVAASSVAWAAQVSTRDIVCGLDPHCTRPISREFRGVTVTPGPGGTDPLSVNLYVNFAYDSAELTSDARIILDRLGQALVDDRLKEFSFMIEGHTDAHGSAPYNQTLSEQRARAVQHYLIEYFGIAEARLVARGFGKTRLLDPSHPEDGVNRRVQVVNLTASAAGQQPGGR
jgi:outer membrane protein OmpA-like peptidoglycan-associated protein